MSGGPPGSIVAPVATSDAKGSSIVRLDAALGDEDLLVAEGSGSSRRLSSVLAITRTSAGRRSRCA